MISRKYSVVSYTTTSKESRAWYKSFARASDLGVIAHLKGYGCL